MVKEFEVCMADGVSNNKYRLLDDNKGREIILNKTKIVYYETEKYNLY